MNWKHLFISVGINFGIGALSSLIAYRSRDIYKQINTPSFTPPLVLFLIIWIILYILMGISSYLVYESDSNLKSIALAVYALQLVAISFFPIVFFYAKSFLIAFVWLTFFNVRLFLFALIFFNAKPFLFLSDWFTFFNAKLFLFAFVWLIFLWILVIWMMTLFYKIKPISSYLQIPYILWLTFTAFLNFMVYYLN